MDLFRQLIGPDEGANGWQLGFRVLPILAFGILCVRIAGRRTFAQYSPLDIVVALIVGSNLSRVLTGKAAFWPALTATLLLVILHRLLAYASLRWRWLGWLVKSRPITIVVDGTADREAMRRGNLTEDDLIAAVRMEQVAEVDDVALAVLEGSGKLSVVPKRRPGKDE